MSTTGPINQKITKSFIPRKAPDVKDAPASEPARGDQEPLQLTPDMKVAEAPTSQAPQTKSAEGVQEQPKAQVAQEPAAETEPQDNFVVVQEDMDLGTVITTPGGIWQKKPDGNYTSDYTIAMVPKKEREKLEAEGVVFPELKAGVMGDELGPDGYVDLKAVHTTQNPGTVNVRKTVEIARELTEVDPETGLAKHEYLKPTLLAEGEQVIPAGYEATLGASEEGDKVRNKQNTANNVLKIVGTLSGSALAGLFKVPVVAELSPILAIGSAGFSFNHTMKELGTSKDRMKSLVEAEKQSPTDLIEMTTKEGVRFKVSAEAERGRITKAVRQARLQLGSTGLLAAAGGVSLASTMGTVGAFGSLGPAATAALGLAGASAPFLAGGAVLLGNGSMVFDSLVELKKLSKERAELEALQKEGKTHVERVLEAGPQAMMQRASMLADERVALEQMKENGETHVPQMVDNKVVNVPIDERLATVSKQMDYYKNAMEATTREIVDKKGRVQRVPVNPKAAPSDDGRSPLVSLGSKAAQIPIEERLKTIDSQINQHRLLATAMTGGMASIGNMLTGSVAGTALGLSTAGLGVVSMAPAGALLAYQSIDKLRDLSKERKELHEAKANGLKMVERYVPAVDHETGVKFEKEMIPISNLLSENKKSVNKNLAILTGVGSAGATAVATLGMGFSLLSVAPFAVVPLAIGAALFPDKVKAFAGRVKDIVNGVVGPEGRTRRATQKAIEKEHSKFSSRLSQRMEEAGFKNSNPEFFAERPSVLGRAFPNPLNLLSDEGKYGGFFTEMDRLAGDYGKAADPLERQEIMKEINKQMASYQQSVSPELLPALNIYREELSSLSMEVEAQWMARNIDLEMRGPVTEKVVNNPKVAERLKDLKFPTEGIKEQYRDSLYLTQISKPENMEVIHKAQQGDYDSQRLLARADVFQAARLLAQHENQLGLEMYTKLLDALERPDDVDNFDLIRKEITYQTNTQFGMEQAQAASQAMAKLNMPIELPPEAQTPHIAKLRASVQEMVAADPEATKLLLETDAKIRDGSNFEGMTAQEGLAARTKLNVQFSDARRALRKAAPDALKSWEEADDKLKTLAHETAEKREEPLNMSPAERRMAAAFDALKKEQPELTTKMGDAFAVINSPFLLRGLDAEQTKLAKVKANLELTKTMAKLERKEPELMELWQTARKDVENEFLDRSVDHEFKARVLGSDTVQQAQEKLGVSSEEAERIYMGLLRAEKLNDSRQLELSLADESGEDKDQNKVDMLSALDKARLEIAAQETKGGADAQPAGPVPPLQDPAVVQLLQNNPAIIKVLNSPEMGKLSEATKVPVEALQGNYLQMLQINANPVMLAEFQGRLQAGDIEAANMNALATEVDKLLLAETRPSPEVLQQKVAEAMDGLVVKSVLTNPQVQELAGNLGVDASELMAVYVTARIGNDPSQIAELEQKAAKGEEVAAKKVAFLQQVIPFTQQVEAQIQAGQLPPGVQVADDAA